MSKVSPGVPSYQSQAFILGHAIQIPPGLLYSTWFPLTKFFEKVLRNKMYWSQNRVHKYVCAVLT